MIDLTHIDGITLDDLLAAARGATNNETDVKVTLEQQAGLYSQLQQTVRYDRPAHLLMTDKSMQWHAIRIYPEVPA